MNSFKVKLVMSVLAYGLMAGAVLGAALYYLFPAFYPQWYPWILAFFLIIEPAILLFVESSSRTSTSRGLVNTYMLTKVIKTVAVLGLIGVYAIVVKVEMKNFALTTMILYVLFLAIETMLFTRIEKRLKEKQENE